MFKNRRGYAPVLMCHDCGWSAQCKRCDAERDDRARAAAAACNAITAAHASRCRRACPDCGSLALQPQGVGTERIEEALRRNFADVPVLRIDRGTTRRTRRAGQQLFETLGDAPGILVGTQMLAKGHDLPHLTLVAVVGVDEGLFSADFRAGEKLAQLLIQVAGRAGRAEKPGEVWLQTHHPEHPLLHDADQRRLSRVRRSRARATTRLRAFPPFAHLALLRAEAKHADAPMAFLHAAKRVSPFEGRRYLLLTSRSQQKSIPPNPPFSRGNTLQGPIPAPMSRRAGMHRTQLLLSSPNRRELHAALEAALPRHLRAARSAQGTLVAGRRPDGSLLT